MTYDQLDLVAVARDVMGMPPAPPEGRALTVDTAVHPWTVNGVVVPSVSDILEAGHLKPDYSKVPLRHMIHARNRGSYVDGCCDVYDEGDLDLDAVAPEALPYVKAWARFVEVEGYTAHHAQPVLYHPVLNYIGRADTVGQVRGLWGIFDRKCTSVVDESYGCQLASYAVDGMYLADAHGVLTPVPWPVPLRGVVWLKPSGEYEVIEYDSPDDEEAFLGAVAIYKWRALRTVKPKKRLQRRRSLG